MTVLAIVTWLTSAAKFLKDAGADGMVKEGAKSVFSWLKEKFKRNSEQGKIVTIEEAPDKENAIKALEQMFIDAQKDDAELFVALQEQLQQFADLVKEKMPEKSSAIQKQILTGEGNINVGGSVTTAEGGISVIGYNNSISK